MVTPAEHPRDMVRPFQPSVGSLPGSAWWFSGTIPPFQGRTQGCVLAAISPPRSLPGPPFSTQGARPSAQATRGHAQRE